MGGVVRRLLIGLVLVLAALGLLFAGQLAQTGEDAGGPVVTGEAVERLIPAAGSEVLAQEPIGVDLAPGYTGVLFLNGVELPEDQLVRRAGIDEILYRPSAEDAAVEFTAGENCAEALVWPVEETREDGRSVTWCFEVT